MPDTNKDLLKKDLLYILQLNTKIHYENPSEVKKAYNMILQKNILTSPIGIRYRKKLEQIISGESSYNKCLFCAGETQGNTMICPDCMGRLKPSATAINAEKKESKVSTGQTIDAPKKNITKQAATKFKGGLDTFTSKINEMAGESGAVDLRLRDLFSGVFQKHTRKESEEIFIAGTLQTTPAESDIAVSWPKPWLFSRVLLLLLASSALLYICATEFNNTNAIPGLMFLGALALPFSVLVFIFETNAPRNISIFEVIKMFFVGGTASLVLALFLFEIFPVGQLDYTGAAIVGFVEELGKLLAVAIFVKILDPKYILNGMLIGASIGAGFAVFETAGYAFRFYIYSGGRIEYLTNILFLRGWSSLGGHVVWAAIIGAGLVMVKGREPFRMNLFFHTKFLPFFFMPMILHAIWDCPFMGEGNNAYIKLIVLIAIAWIIILVLLNAGLKQIEKVCAAYQQPMAAIK